VLCYDITIKEGSRFALTDDLITKKDLLELADISYGQLYRWKRKNLIPEEWFIRKSTFTGQETFFPREKILQRIEKIQQMKENLSLDELADMFSPNLKEMNLALEEVIKRGIASQPVLNFFRDQIEGASSDLSFAQIFYVFILEKLLSSGQINLDEAKMVLEVLTENYPSVKDKQADLIFMRKLGVSTCALVAEASDIHFEKTAKVVVHLSLSVCLEELKPKLL
jgi:hypothetical protein